MEKEFIDKQILVVDKKGIIARVLCEKFEETSTIVLVSQNPLTISGKKIINIPFTKKFPKIPRSHYPFMFVISDDASFIKDVYYKFLEKAIEDRSFIVFAFSILAIQPKIIEKFRENYKRTRVVIYGEILETHNFISTAKKLGIINIPGHGLTKTFPIFLEDITKGIIDSIFSKIESSIFYCFPRPVTELSLAHMISKANPEIKIDFTKEVLRNKIIIPENGKYLFDNYPLAQKIRKFDLTKGEGKKENKLPDRKTKKIPFVFWGTIIFLIFLPFIFTLFFSILGDGFLHYGKKKIDPGNFLLAQSSIRLSNSMFALAKKSSEILLLETGFIGQENYLKPFLKDIEMGENMSLGALSVLDAQIFFENIINGKSKNPKEDFAKGEISLKNAILIFQKSKGEGQFSKNFAQEINDMDEIIKLLSNTTGIWSEILGFNGARKYLVLFQDKMELRPGGGLIDSYGILKLNMGKIDFSMHAINDADMQLKGHVEPPFAIRRYLPIEHWYMRDSNFDLDFRRAGKVTQDFLNIETKEKTDGVIAVDKNFFENLKKSSFSFSSMKILSKALLEKQLLLYFNDNFQNIFTVNGWSSSLFDERIVSQNSINDFLGINESNLGANKVNFFIKRNLSQVVEIKDDGSIVNKITIKYKNESNSGLGGEYKNYLRIILPANAILNSVLINDVPQVLIDAITDPLIYEAKNFKPSIGLEVEKTSEENKTIYGFLIKVPERALAKVIIEYILSQKVPLDAANFSYNLRLFKEPGIDSIPYSFSIKYPKSFKINSGNNSYSEPITKDKDLNISFVQK